MKRCPKCNFKLNKRQKFCPECGEPIVIEGNDLGQRNEKRIRTTIIALSVVLVIVILSTTCGSLMQKKFSQDTEAMAKAEESVVKIYCYDVDGQEVATGSGFVMFEEDVIITNYHVIEDTFSVKISTNQDITFSVLGFVAIDKEQDIAILKTDKKTLCSPLVAGDSLEAKKGETVTAVGSPMGIKNTVSIGNLSGRIMNGNYDILQFTAPISHGSSGGALFNERGQVIGITYASVIDSQNLNLAIPIELVISLYDKNKSNAEIGLISDEYFLNHIEEYYTYTYGTPTRVSFEQLKNSPEMYENKMVIVESYVSSIDKLGNLRMGVYLGYKEDITNNAVFDGLSKNRNKYIYASTNIVKSNPLSLGISNNIQIQSGDKVSITGVFRKYAEMDEYFIKVKAIDFLN